MISSVLDVCDVQRLPALFVRLRCRHGRQIAAWAVPATGLALHSSCRALPSAVAQGLNALPLAQDVGNMHQLLALESSTAVSKALSEGCLCAGCGRQAEAGAELRELFSGGG